MSALKPYARIHALVTGAFVLAAASNLSGAVDTSTYVIQAKKTTWPVRVDGLLQEPAWRSAPVVGDFVQKEPQEGAPASERTEVRILYDDANLYIGVVCFDGDPSRIVAREMRRDIELTNEDMFEVIIDTFHDHRNAFLFAVNPLGARRDALIRDEGGSLNVDWDGIWTVRTHRDSAGWSAEIAIPFTTLRFRDSDEQNWGINFARLIARKREEIYWTPILRSYGWLGRFKTSYFGHLAGLRRLRQGTRVQAMPYVIGGGKKEDRPEPFLGTANLGLDLKLRLTSNITGDLTVNTDFAQVEADQERFNLTRFDLFFPEKREFFLEGADIFRFGERFQEHEPPSTLLFFSRTIGLSEDGREIPVLGGLKVTGKAGPYTLGLLDILTDRTSYDEDGERIDIRRANNAVVRLKRDIFAKSSVGIMVLSKDAVGGGGTDFNRAGGLDFNLAFGESIRAGGFLAKTFSPGLRGRDWGGYLNLVYETDLLQSDLSYADIGENFNAEMGFVPRTDIRKWRWNAGVSPRPGVLGLRQIYLFNNLTYIEDHGGRLESRNNMAGAFNMFQNGSILFFGVISNLEVLEESFEIKDGVFIPVGRYRYDMLAAFFESDRTKSVYLRSGLDAGGFYNGDFVGLDAQAGLRLSGQLHLELTLNRNRFDLPVPGGRFTTTIAGTRLIYSFTPDLYAKAYLQWNDAERLFKSNFQVRWIYRPGANLYFIYNETRKLGGAGYLQDRIVMLKVSFLFNT